MKVYFHYFFVFADKLHQAVSTWKTYNDSYEQLQQSEDKCSDQLSTEPNMNVVDITTLEQQLNVYKVCQKYCTFALARCQLAHRLSIYSRILSKKYHRNSNSHLLSISKNATLMSHHTYIE